MKFSSEKTNLFSLRKNGCGKREKRHTENLNQIESKKNRFQKIAFFKSFAQAAPVESAENVIPRFQQDPFSTKQTSFAKRFPSLSTVSNHF